VREFECGPKIPYLKNFIVHTYYWKGVTKKHLISKRNLLLIIKMSSKNTKKKRNLEEELLTYKGALPLECITLNSFRAFNNCKVKYSHEQQKFYETQPFTLKRKNLLRAADREPIQAVEKTKKKIKK
jgi:hypothetical protein